MKFSIFLICGIIPSLFAKCNVREAKPHFKRSVYEFSTNLLTRIALEEKDHFVSSPLSAWVLLASTARGATGITMDEFKQVLRLKNNKCFNNKFLKIVNNIKSHNNTDVISERTSSIYVDEKLKILKRFKNKVWRTDVSEFQSLSFEDAVSAAQIINDYVSRATHESIKDIVSPGELANVLMIIIDAIYFKGSWKTPFLSNTTKASPFYNRQGNKIGDVNLMFLSASLKFRAINNIKAKVLELPYGNDNRYSMLIFLPFSEVSLHSVIENLKLIDLSTIKDMLEEFGKENILVQIPRFKITSDLRNLKELLIDMGLKTMFDSSEASFQLISEFPLYVSNFIQKANIEVTEEGTLASAATEADFSYRSTPDEFIANKPFLFMITDNKVEVPLFIGAYSEPSLF